MNVSWRMISGIMLALVAWGIYLAVGATGMFVQESMMDVRKSVVVVVCVAIFLGLWSVVLFGRKKPGVAGQPPTSSDELGTEAQPAETEVASGRNAGRLPLSRAGIAALLWVVFGVIFWVIAIATWQQVSTDVTTIFGWFAAFCVMASATSGMIALSDPTRRPGKWLGLLGLVGFAACLVSFIARMTPG